MHDFNGNIAIITTFPWKTTILSLQADTSPHHADIALTRLILNNHQNFQTHSKN
jgi:hypothetical protein